MAVTSDDIVRAFPADPTWTDPVPGCPPEIVQIERDFRGKCWIEITTAMCNRHDDAFCMLDAEPLAYFLPAFLRAAIDDPGGVAAEMFVYFVCSGRANAVYQQLTDEQREVMLGVTAWLLEHDDGYYRSGEKSRFVERLREWNDR